MEISKRQLKMIERALKLKQGNPKTPIKDVHKLFEQSNENMHLLDKCRNLYDDLAEIRRKVNRNTRYVYGDQWGDIIDTPFGKMTEAEYIRTQRVVPLTTNVIRKLINSALGIYYQMQQEPIAVARDKDESKYGEMMTVMLQYVLQINAFKEIDRRAFEEAMITGFYISRDNFSWDNERERYDIDMHFESLSNLFFNSNMKDIRMKDLDIIGFLRDYSIDELLGEFAESKEQAKQLEEIYSYVLHRNEGHYNRDYLDNRTTQHKDFYGSDDPTKCRVIEVWSLEQKSRLKVHDRLTGEYYKAEEDEKDRFDQINAQRVKELGEAGGKLKEALLIEYEFYFDRYWYYRYLTPRGYCIKEGETPYAHGSHPYTISAYPLVNGEVHPKVSDVIDQQRYINRLITQRDIANGISMKGLTVYDVNSLRNAGLTPKDMDEALSKPGSSIGLDLKNGVMPQQIFTPPNVGGDMELTQMMLQMIGDIFGNSMATRGETPANGTPLGIYAIQAQQTSTNMADFIGWYHATNQRRFLKLIKLIQQYYTEPMYLNVAGRNYSEEAKVYTPNKVGNVDFDVLITQSSNSPLYRFEAENILQFIVQSGLLQNLDMAIFYAENSQSQFSGQLAEKLKSLKQEQEQMAEQMAEQQTQVAPANPFPTIEGGELPQEEQVITQ